MTGAAVCACKPLHRKQGTVLPSRFSYCAAAPRFWRLKTFIAAGSPSQIPCSQASLTLNCTNR